LFCSFEYPVLSTFDLEMSIKKTYGEPYYGKLSKLRYENLEFSIFSHQNTTIIFVILKIEIKYCMII